MSGRPENVMHETEIKNKSKKILVIFKNNFFLLKM